MDKIAFPSGTITFLFTDIEGSTQLLSQLRDQYATLLADQRRILRDAFADWHGQEVDTQGDSFFVAFPRATQAACAAVEIQRALAANTWPEDVKVRVRMGLHTGEPLKDEEGYVGMDVHRAARIAHVGHGGQVLLSETSAALVRDELPEGVSFLDLGRHHLKDLHQPEHIRQLVIEGLPSEFPPLKTRDAYPNNLPVQFTSLIGRDEELVQIAGQLEDPACRLLTLVGIGGIGKTRLALQAASEAFDYYTDGVWLAELATLFDAEFLPEQVASVLGVAALEVREGCDVTDVLVDYLRNKNLLLVLDNCEHIIEACAGFAEILLKRCLHVKLLATSREDLGIPGEKLFHVSPLGLPSRQTSLINLKMNAAIRLFVDRAAAVRTGFDLTEDNADVLTEICHHLDGIPLAIELAAARVKVITPEQIAVRLENRFQLLSGGPRTALPRHQTMQATMDWSYSLLSEAECAFLRRLAVFSGGWTLEAAEEVANYGKLAKEHVLDLLTQLVDKSLVVVEERGHIVRYGLLETVRQYGYKKLSEEGESEEVCRRHATYFMRLAEDADAGLRDAQQLACLKVLEVEHNNLRTVLRWSIDKRETNLAFRLVGAMGWFWFLHGNWKEARRWLNKTLALSTDSSPTLRAKAIYRAGGLELIRGNLVGTTELVEDALNTCREVDDKEGLAWCLNLLGQARLWSDEGVNEAAHFLSESVEIFNSLENDWGLAWSLRYLGTAVVFQGDYERGIKLQKHGIHIFEEIGDMWNTAHSLFLMGNSAYRQSDFQEAISAYEDSLVMSGLFENKVIAAHSQRGLAQLALKSDDLQHAEELFRESLEVFQKIGDDSCTARTMVFLAEVGQRKGDHEQAEEFLNQALRRFVKLGNEDSIVWAFERFAALAELTGRLEMATRLLAAADAQHGRGDIPLSPTRRGDYEDVVTSVRKLLGDQAFELLWAEGAAMSLQEAVAYALEESRQN